MKNRVLEIGVVETDEEGNYVFSLYSKIIPIPSGMDKLQPNEIVKELSDRIG